MKIVMLGGPGAGKGTQAIQICEKFSLPHISTGDIFRANIKAGTELGRKAAEYINKGLLVPDELTTNLLVDRISQPDCVNGYVLDGFPRTIPQAECLTGALRDRNESLDFAINIDVADEVIISRMSGRRTCPKCGGTFHIENARPKEEGICDYCGTVLVKRADDSEETVAKRLSVYHEMTQPLIEYYNEEGILKNVDGALERDEVFSAILGILEA